MARIARIVIPSVPHHVTQRGNRRQTVFFGGDDYLAYLGLLTEHAGKAGVRVWAWCLMPNHVHLMLAPPWRRRTGAILETRGPGRPERAGEISIVSPELDALIPRLSGPYTGTARDLLARDIRNLRIFTKAPNSSLQDLINLNKEMYPGAFAK